MSIILRENIFLNYIPAISDRPMAAAGRPEMLIAPFPEMREGLPQYSARSSFNLPGNKAHGMPLNYAADKRGSLRRHERCSTTGGLFEELLHRRTARTISDNDRKPAGVPEYAKPQRASEGCGDWSVQLNRAATRWRRRLHMREMFA